MKRGPMFAVTCSDCRCEFGYVSSTSVIPPDALCPSCGNSVPFAAQSWRVYPIEDAQSPKEQEPAAGPIERFIQQRLHKT